MERALAQAAAAAARLFKEEAMRLCFVKRLRAWTLVAGLLGLGAPAYGQTFYQGGAPCPPSPCAPSPGAHPVVPPAVTPAPSTPTPAPAPSTTPAPSPTPEPSPTPTPEPSPAPTPTPETATPNLAGLTPESSLALGGETFAAAEARTGYIDPALPFNNFRLRWDNGFDDNRPDRAEFFYSRNSFANVVPATNPVTGRPNAGVPLGAGGSLLQPAFRNAYPTSVDFHELSAYLEVAPTERFSVFVEAPYLWLEPADLGIQENGWSDLNAGMKYAFIENKGTVATAQFRTYVPTGQESRGLGTGHVSLEPALLFHQALTRRLFFDSEFRDWIPIGGTDFAGNVTRYGTGLSYDLVQRRGFYVCSVGEIVGWTVLSGKELVVFPPEFGPDGNATSQHQFVKDASGDTIVNAKVGVRVGFGEGSSIYVGYGRALTGTVWYKDMFRLEYRMAF